MARIIALAGSNSSNSINYALVKHTVSMLDDHEVQLLDMARFPLPMFSEDHERENGHSRSMLNLNNDIARADGMVISVNEHNSNPSAYFKNLIDWLSRIDRNFLGDKPVLLMSTSRGKRGGAGALEVTRKVLPRFGANTVATFSLPFFNENFSVDSGISDSELAETHREALQKLVEALKA